MTVAHNDITGDLLKTKGANNAYRDGWDRIYTNRPREYGIRFSKRWSE